MNKFKRTFSVFMALCLLCTFVGEKISALSIVQKYDLLFRSQHQSKESPQQISLRITTPEDMITLMELLTVELNDADRASYLGYAAEVFDADDCFSSDESSLDLTIVDNCEKIVGQINLRPGSNDNGINIGYVITKEFRGKGYAAAATKEVMRKIWAADEKAEFEFWIDDENIASIKTIKKVAESFGINFDNPKNLRSVYELKKHHCTMETTAAQNEGNPDEYTLKITCEVANCKNVLYEYPINKANLLTKYSEEKVNNCANAPLLKNSITKYSIKNLSECARLADLLYERILEFLELHKNVTPEEFETVCSNYMKDNGGIPTYLDREEFDKQVDGKTLLYRGISTQAHADAFKQGEVYIGKNADNVRGCGIYTTSNEDCAKIFAEEGAIMKMFLNKDFKLLENADLEKIMKLLYAKHKEEICKFYNPSLPKRNYKFDPFCDYVNNYFKEKTGKEFEEVAEGEYYSVLETLKQDPVIQKMKKNRHQYNAYFKDKRVSMIFNRGLLAKLLGYDVLTTFEFDGDLGTDIDEYLVLDPGVLTVCK